jgi:hypothetical protein
MTSQDDLTLLKQMYQRGEITDEEYDVLRRHVLWGTPLPELMDEPPAAGRPAPPPARTPVPPPPRGAGGPPAGPPAGRPAGGRDPAGPPSGRTPAGPPGGRGPGGPPTGRVPARPPAGRDPGGPPSGRTPAVPPAGRDPGGPPTGRPRAAPLPERDPAGPPSGRTPAIPRYGPGPPPQGFRPSDPRGIPAPRTAPRDQLDEPDTRAARRRQAGRSDTTARAAPPPPQGLPAARHQPPPATPAAPPAPAAPPEAATRAERRRQAEQSGATGRGKGRHQPPETPRRAKGRNQPAPPADAAASRDAGPDTAPGWDVGAATAPGWDVSSSPALGRDAGPDTAPGWETGSATAPGWDVGSSPALGRDAGPDTAPGWETGAATAPGWDVGSATVPGWETGAGTGPGWADAVQPGYSTGQRPVPPAGYRGAERPGDQPPPADFRSVTGTRKAMPADKPEKARPARRRGPRLVVVIMSLVLAAALTAAGVWWFTFRGDPGVAPAAYAQSVCTGVRDWQQNVTGQSTVLQAKIAPLTNLPAKRTAVAAYYTSLATRTDGLQGALTSAGVPDVAGGEDYTRELIRVVGEQAAALRDSASRAGRLDISSASLFEISLNSLLTNASKSVDTVTEALAHPAIGIPPELTTAFEADPTCAAYTG